MGSGAGSSLGGAWLALNGFDNPDWFFGWGQLPQGNLKRQHSLFQIIVNTCQAISLMEHLNERGMTAMHVACSQGHMQMAMALHAGGASPL